MRRLCFALLAALIPASALAASLEVPLNQAVRMSLSAPGSDIIVGNPAVADVQVADPRHLVITGKAYGVTNLIVTAANGRTILNRQILVGASAGSQVSLIAGAVPIDYTCSPTCIQAPPTGPVTTTTSSTTTTTGPAATVTAPGAGAAPAGVTASPGTP